MILHFGVHKTGSTSIQRSLFHNLKDPRFHYVRGLGENASWRLLMAFDPDNLYKSKHRVSVSAISGLQKRGVAIRERLHDEIARALDRGTTPILSGEGVSRMSPPRLRRLLDFLRNIAGPVRAVGYMRPPKGMMESKFQQRMKAPHDERSLTPEMFRYRSFLEGLLESLGHDQVELHLFDRRALHQGCVVQDFCRRAGIDFDPVGVITANESLSRDAVCLLWLHHQHHAEDGPDPAWARQMAGLVRTIRTLEGPPFHLHSEWVAPLIEAVRPEREWMEHTFGISLGEDPTRHDAVAIRSLEELRRISPAAAAWLDLRTGTADWSTGQPRYSPEAAGQAMSLLRRQCPVVEPTRSQSNLARNPWWRRVAAFFQRLQGRHRSRDRT